MSDRARNLPLFRSGIGLGGQEPTLPVVAAPGPSITIPGTAGIASDRLPAAPPGYGKLVKAAWPLLMVLARLRNGALATQPDSLKAACIKQIKQFEQDAAVAGVPPDPLGDARYALCTALDEAVLATPWGDNSDWAQDSLLATMHGETWGGEKVFAILDRVLAAPDRDADLAEVLYLLLSFGFQGQYHLRRNGAMEVETLRERLYAGMRRRLGDAPSLPDVVVVAPRRRRLGTYVPIWAVVIVTFLAAVLLFLWFEDGLLDQSRAIVPRFNAVLPGGA